MLLNSKTENLILCGLIVLFIPFLLLCFFTHPQNDDFNYSLKTITLGYLGANICWYKFWSGRYFSTALLSMNPLVVRDFGVYKLVTAGTIILVLYAFYFFVNRMFSTILEKKKIVIISLALFILYLARMPSLVQGFYFMTSAVTYQSGNILFLIICGYLFRIRKFSDQQRNILITLILSALIFASAGTNEVNMVLTLEICVLCFLWDYIVHRRMNVLLAVATSTSIISTAIVVLAPGSGRRFETTRHLDLISALQSSLTYGASSAAQWFILTPLLPIGLLSVPVLSKWLARRKVLPFTVSPLWSLTVSSMMYVSLFFPSFYSTAHVEARTVNVIYLFFLISIFFNIVILIDNATDRGKELKVFSSRIGILMLCALILIMFIVPRSNVKTAISDLVTGSAYYYDKELKQRYQIINDCRNRQGDVDPYVGKGEDLRLDIQQADNEICQVPPLKHTPKSIYFDEMALDPRKNESYNIIRYKLTYAYYFQRRAIILNYDKE